MTANEIAEIRIQAKAAYDLLELRTPWDLISPRLQERFQAIARYFLEEPTCQKCGDVLLCTGCDEETVYEECLDDCRRERGLKV